MTPAASVATDGGAISMPIVGRSASGIGPSNNRFSTRTSSSPQLASPMPNSSPAQPG